MRDWREKNPEAQKTLERRNRERNHDKLLAASRASHHAHKDERNAKRRVWHGDHRVEANKKRRENYEQNFDREAATRKKGRQAMKQRAPWRILMGSAKGRASARGIHYSLTNEWGEANWTGKCSISQIPFVTSKRHQHPFSPSIDRIDPALGYTPSNCRFILMGINAMKGNGSDADLILIVRAVEKEWRGLP